MTAAWALTQPMETLKRINTPLLQLANSYTCQNLVFNNLQFRHFTESSKQPVYKYCSRICLADLLANLRCTAGNAETVQLSSRLQHDFCAVDFSTSTQIQVKKAPKELPAIC